MIYSILALGLAGYVLIGVCVVYLLASYYKPFNQGRDVMLGEGLKVCAVGAFLWPFFIGLIIYEIFFEGLSLSGRPFIRYKGRK